MTDTPNTPPNIRSVLIHHIERYSHTDADVIADEALQAIREIALGCAPDPINYHESIGFVVGHDDAGLENYDRGYNKAVGSYTKNLRQALGVPATDGKGEDITFNGGNRG